ncbi:MAG: MarR family transcriptional regulator [Eubacteriales bacterium]
MNEVESVGLLIKKIHDAIGAITNIELKELDLTMSQSRVLYFLYQVRGHNVSIREIENHFCVKHTTALGILNRLEIKGFITSTGSRDDKRVRNVEITTKGKKIHEAILSKFSNLEERYLKGFTSEELKSLKMALTVINSNLQELRF